MSSLIIGFLGGILLGCCVLGVATLIEDCLYLCRRG